MLFPLREIALAGAVKGSLQFSLPYIVTVTMEEETTKDLIEGCFKIYGSFPKWGDPNMDPNIL